MNTPEETLDLMRDEFLRIASLTYNLNESALAEEIRGLCQRAAMAITVRVPLIQQRDNAERDARSWERRYNEQAYKISERKTVHQWLNQIEVPDKEATGKPMCLLRRLAVALKIQPHISGGVK